MLWFFLPRKTRHGTCLRTQGYPYRNRLQHGGAEHSQQAKGLSFTKFAKRSVPLAIFDLVIATSYSSYAFRRRTEGLAVEQHSFTLAAARLTIPSTSEVLLVN